jgi:transcriptional regulator with XRE-family HTH domain
MLFRLARAMTLDELASAIGGLVTKQAISKYERGLMLPSPRVLGSLARALGVRLSELLAAPQVTVEVLGFRKLSRLAAREQDRVRAVVSRMLEHRVQLQQATGQGNGCDCEIPVSKYRSATLQDCEAIAGTLRDAWSLGVGPIPSVTDVLEEHHIHVLELDTGRAIDGVAAVARDDSGAIRAAAVVSRRGLPGDLQRLSLVHELGHLVMQAAPGVDSEKAAIRFGAAFLAPADLVRGDVGVSRRRVALGELILLKRRYGMSIQSLIYRLRDLGIISEGSTTALWRQVNGRGWKQEEPDPLDPERPQWARRAALRAIAEGSLTVDEAEIMIGIRPDTPRPPETTERRDLMKLPLSERNRRLKSDALRASEDYVEDREWATLLGGDLLPDE